MSDDYDDWGDHDEHTTHWCDYSEYIEVAAKHWKYAAYKKHYDHFPLTGSWIKSAYQTSTFPSGEKTVVHTWDFMLETRNSTFDDIVNGIRIVYLRGSANTPESSHGSICVKVQDRLTKDGIESKEEINWTDNY